MGPRSSVNRAAAAWCLAAVLSHAAAVGRQTLDVRLDADVSRLDRKVDEKFLSLAVDASLMADPKFMCLLSSPKLRTLARALTPAFLRFGGTQQDFLTFKPESEDHLKQFSRSSSPNHLLKALCGKSELLPRLEERLKQEWSAQSAVLHREELRGKFEQSSFSEQAVDLLYSFANCSGLELIFGLNALLRTQENVWNSTNAELLMNYGQSKQYRMSWELGNEPNSYEKKAGIRVNGSQLGLDFLHLRKILQKFELYRSSGLYGPDIGQPRDRRLELLAGFLESGAEAIDACTWHHYYVNGRDTTLEDFLDPQVLDMLAVKTDEILQVVRSGSPGKKVWLGETSSAYGGGAAGLSDTFAAGFMWLDKLGLAAKLGLDVVIRQVFIGAGTYHLVDENLDPLPDYWLSLLYKRLVGPEVLKVEVLSNKAKQRSFIRVYLHCTNRNSSSYRPGAVTLFALNLSKRQATISLPAGFSNSTIEEFTLQPGDDELLSRAVKLNGKVLKMPDDRTLPDLHGADRPAADRLGLPARSFSFHVVTQAGAPVC